MENLPQNGGDLERIVVKYVESVQRISPLVLGERMYVRDVVGRHRPWIPVNHFLEGGGGRWEVWYAGDRLRTRFLSD